MIQLFKLTCYPLENAPMKPAFVSWQAGLDFIDSFGEKMDEPVRIDSFFGRKYEEV